MDIINTNFIYNVSEYKIIVVYHMNLLGIYGGYKLTTSAFGLPLSLSSPIQISEPPISVISQSLVLVFTGKTRLARNLLQDVIKRWYTKEPDIGTFSYCINRGAGNDILLFYHSIYDST